MTVPNSNITIDDQENVVMIEAAEKHVPKLIEELGLHNAKSQRTPRVKRSAGEQEQIDQSPLMDRERVRLYCGGTMRMKYLVQEKRFCRGSEIASPGHGSPA